MYHSKNVERQRENLERSKRKMIHHIQGNPILTADFSSEQWQSEGSGITYLKLWKKKMLTKNHISTKTISQRWSWHSQTKIEFVAIRLTLQKILKEVIQAVTQDNNSHSNEKTKSSGKANYVIIKDGIIAFFFFLLLIAYA